jgi:hypothetical protein
MVKATPRGAGRCHLRAAAWRVFAMGSTFSGRPLGSHSRPPFLKSPTNSFFFESTEITGWFRR